MTPFLFNKSLSGGGGGAILTFLLGGGNLPARPFLLFFFRDFEKIHHLAFIAFKEILFLLSILV